jgi:type IV pilus assembly protein PilW
MQAQPHIPRPAPILRNLAPQRGVTLVELMVGIAIGLLVVAVAMGALMVSRGVSGTVSDASGIQQQAAYAMRLFGQQLRQAGSMRLNLNPGTVATEVPYLAPVAFETTADDPNGYGYNASVAAQTIIGATAPETLTVGFRRYTEPVFVGATEQSLARNCLGGPADNPLPPQPIPTAQRIESVFEFDAASNTLRCNGNGIGVQPVLRNVANFQVRYQLQDTTSTPGSATVRMVDAAAVGNWAQVQGVQVCLVLYGNEAIDLPRLPNPPLNDPSTSYTDCGGNPVDLRSLIGNRAQRMHMAFRNVFEIRSHGLLGSVLQPI